MNVSPSTTGVTPYAVAAAIGLVLGFEREHHEWNEHRQPVPAGTRTLAIVAISGAVGARLDPVVVAGGAIAVTLLLAVGYWRSDPEQLGQTTEFTGLAAFLLGALCIEDARLAAGLAAGLAVLLESKSRMRSLLREVVTADEVEDAIRWFALAFVVLPLMPEGRFGPDEAIAPERIWRLLLILTGIGWLGHIATRAVGRRRGMLISGAAGGFISGAATTASLARLARRDPSVRDPALGGALLASVATCVQLAVMVSITSGDLGRRLVPPMAAGAVTLAVTALVVVRAAGPVDHPPMPSPAGRPLAWGSSAAAAAVLTVTLAASTILARRVGRQAIVAATAAAGLADTHAAALSAATLHADGIVGARTAVQAVGFALAANTVTKLVMATVGGGLGFARRFALLIAPAVAVVTASMWWASR